MTKITFVAPYKQMKKVAEEAAAEYLGHDIDLNLIELVGAIPVGGLEIDSDVIIARGVTAKAIREQVRDIPVIELPVTGYDVVRAVHECKERYSSKRIAIIGSSNMIYGAQSLHEILGVDVNCYHVHKEEEARHLIEKVIGEGIDTIIGGVMTVEFATKLNVNCALIMSGKEAVYQSLEEAVRTVEVARKERERAELFKTIMDYAHEGIIAVDKDGIVNALNQSAKKLMGTSSEHIIGKPINEITPVLSLSHILHDGKEEIGILDTINDTLIAANKVAIKVEDKIVGAVATFQNVAQLQEIEGKIRKKIHHKGLVAKYRLEDILGESQAIKDIKEICKDFSSVDSNILIEGETGTGKELIAQGIHNASNRSPGPFVAVNCAALPENLLESELFGYVEGAFTGASKGGKAGLFELAHKGTIFLDEISELSPLLQGRLLRVLQEREIMRLGHDRVIPIDVRVISATNKSLKNMVAEGKFREDLIYRLDVLKILTPPLRVRKEDIITIAGHFIDSYNKKFRRNVKVITPQAKAKIIGYDWPGNVRELKNICERLVVLNKGETVEVEIIRKVIEVDDGLLRSEGVKNKQIQEVNGSFKDMEIEIIENALKKTAGNKAEAARVLGVSRTTLWRKLKEHKIV